MLIEVKQEHIDNGEARFCDACAVALAIKDAFPNAKNIEVQSAHDIWVDGTEYTVKEQDKPKLNSFIHYFDSEMKVEPITFNL